MADRHGLFAERRLGNSDAPIYCGGQARAAMDEDAGGKMPPFRRFGPGAIAACPLVPSTFHTTIAAKRNDQLLASVNEDMCCSAYCAPRLIYSCARSAWG